MIEPLQKHFVWMGSTIWPYQIAIGGGMILVVIAAQMILEGLIAVFPAWVGTS